MFRTKTWWYLEICEIITLRCRKLWIYPKYEFIWIVKSLVYARLILWNQNVCEFTTDCCEFTVFVTSPKKAICEFTIYSVAFFANSQKKNICEFTMFTLAFFVNSQRKRIYEFTMFALEFFVISQNQCSEFRTFSGECEFIDMTRIQVFNHKRVYDKPSQVRVGKESLSSMLYW